MKLKFIIFALLTPLGSFAHTVNEAPELWSWFKQMNKSADACKIQSTFILQKIGIENLVENEYGIYGTLKNNRIVVKCQPDDNNSTLWVAVAGPDRISVELTRNIIIREIN